ncbi:MAG: dihydroxyacetone kinase subunit DhaL [Bacteroidales bacterium]
MTTLTIDKFKDMIRQAFSSIKEREDEFSQLDAVIGDGDHGTAIVQALSSVVEKLDDSTDYKQLLNDAGFNVMLQTSGSTSTLIGGFLLGMSDHAAGSELNISQLKEMFNGGLEGVRKQTKAQPGDKTMMDALVPAVNALSLSQSEDIRTLMQEAAAAAHQGALATVDMKANFGRARNYGERSIGFPDSGATSWACMFEAFAKAL